MMIYYCESCEKYWRDNMLQFVWDWIYTDKEGYPLIKCPNCTNKEKEAKKTDLSNILNEDLKDGEYEK